MKKLLISIVFACFCANGADLIVSWDQNPKEEGIVYYLLTYSFKNFTKTIELPPFINYYKITNINKGNHRFIVRAQNKYGISQPSTTNLNYNEKTTILNYSIVNP